MSPARLKLLNLFKFAQPIIAGDNNEQASTGLYAASGWIRYVLNYTYLLVCAHN
jgi:hypothetical protein